MVDGDDNGEMWERGRRAGLVERGFICVNTKGYKDDESGTLRYELRWEMDGTRYTSVFSCVSKIVCLAALSLPNLLPGDFYPLKRTLFLLTSLFIDVFF